MPERVYSNNAVYTTLQTGLTLNGSETTITVGDTTDWPTPASGQVAIGCLDFGTPASTELFSYTGKNATQFTGVTRGIDGTPKPAHSVGAVVRHVISSEDAENAARINTKNSFSKRQQFSPDDGPAGSFHYGSLIDIATTNQVRNPSFEVDTTGWSTTGSPTFARDTSIKYIGTASGKVSVPTGANFAGVITPPRADADVAAAANDIWSASAWIYTATTKTVRLYLQYLTSGDGSISGGTHFVDSAGSGWRRVTVTGAAPATTAKVEMQATNNNTDQGAFDFYIDGAQLEEQFWPTTYCDGTLGPGYAWSGTAHDSASTRAAGFHIISSKPAFISYNEELIGQFSKSGTLSVGSGTHRFFPADNWIVTRVKLAVGTAPQGANVTIDINKSGTTMFTTGGNRPYILAGNTTGSSPTIIENACVTTADVLTVDIDTVGSTTAGSDLVVSIYDRRV